MSTPTVLCCGDSLTAGMVPKEPNAPYSKTLAKTLGVPVDEIGICGTRADAMLENLEGDRGILKHLRRKEYTVVVIMVGTNDLSYSHPAEQILSDVQKLHALCHRRGVRTIALPIPPSKYVFANSVPTIASHWRVYNKALEEWAATLPGKVLFVNTNNAIPFSTSSGDWASDGLHMTSQGYAALGRYLGQQAAKYVLDTPSSPPSTPPMPPLFVAQPPSSALPLPLSAYANQPIPPQRDSPDLLPFVTHTVMKVPSSAGQAPPLSAATLLPPNVAPRPFTSPLPSTAPPVAPPPSPPVSLAPPSSLPTLFAPPPIPSFMATSYFGQPSLSQPPFVCTSTAEPLVADKLWINPFQEVTMTTGASSLFVPPAAVMDPFVFPSAQADQSFVRYTMGTSSSVSANHLFPMPSFFGLSHGG